MWYIKHFVHFIPFFADHSTENNKSINEDNSNLTVDINPLIELKTEKVQENVEVVRNDDENDGTIHSVEEWWSVFCTRSSIFSFKLIILITPYRSKILSQEKTISMNRFLVNGLIIDKQTRLKRYQLIAKSLLSLAMILVLVFVLIYLLCEYKVNLKLYMSFLSAGDTDSYG